MFEKSRGRYSIRPIHNKSLFDSASAARVIQQANNLQKPIYTVTTQNINEIIPILTPNLPTAAINDIRNAVNANMEVTVPETVVPLNGQDYYAYVKRDIATNSSDFVLDALAGGEMVNASLKASDLLMDGSANNYKLIMTPMVDWLKVAEDSTTNAGLAYLPAITALNNWYANRSDLDPVTTIAAIIAVSGPITKVYNQPAILNVVTGDKLISPNGDGIKDSFTLRADVTKGATWKWQVTNPAGTVILSEEKTTPTVDIIFDQNVPDGTYSYRLTAVANGVNADPISGTFKVDCTQPTVAISQPDPATTVTDNKSLALRGTADDINFEKVIITAQYAYAHCDPVNGIDPSGYFTIVGILTLAAISITTTTFFMVALNKANPQNKAQTLILGALFGTSMFVLLLKGPQQFGLGLAMSLSSAVITLLAEWIFDDAYSINRNPNEYLEVFLKTLAYALAGAAFGFEGSGSSAILLAGLSTFIIEFILGSLDVFLDDTETWLDNWGEIFINSLSNALIAMLTAGLAKSTAFNKSGRALDDSSVTKVSKFIAWSLSCWFSAAIQSLALGSKKMAGYK